MEAIAKTYNTRQDDKHEKTARKQVDCEITEWGSVEDLLTL